MKKLLIVSVLFISFYGVSQTPEGMIQELAKVVDDVVCIYDKDHKLIDCIEYGRLGEWIIENKFEKGYLRKEVDGVTTECPFPIPKKEKYLKI